MVFKPHNAESLPLTLSDIENCVIHIKSWMTANMLQLNMDKTEVLLLTNKSLRNPFTINKIKIDSINMSTANSVRNLGAIFDSALSSEAFMKPACFNLFNISRRSLTTDAAKILIQAYVMSKIDYCNSLLYGIPDKLLNRIQNYAARVVLRLHKFSHITPALATLHWLPVNRQIDFKIALLVNNALNAWSNPSLYSRSPAALRSTPEAVLGWQATPVTGALSFEIIWWPCVMLCSSSCIKQYPSQCEDCWDCWQF